MRKQPHAQDNVRRPGFFQAELLARGLEQLDGLPEGSSTRICRPPGPVTTSFRNLSWRRAGRDLGRDVLHD